MKSTDIILQQLGGARFVAMTGAKNFVADSKSGWLMFSIGRGAKNKINKVRVQLNARDLYDITFWRWSPTKLDLKEIETVTDVHVENLREVFTDRTGFDTHL